MRHSTEAQITYIQTQPYKGIVHYNPWTAKDKSKFFNYHLLNGHLTEIEKNNFPTIVERAEYLYQHVGIDYEKYLLVLNEVVVDLCDYTLHFKLYHNSKSEILDHESAKSFAMEFDRVKVFTKEIMAMDCQMTYHFVDFSDPLFDPYGEKYFCT